MKDILINDKYRAERKLGGGGFGVVYSGTDLESGEEIAIKLEYVRNDHLILEQEARVYGTLAGGVGIPRMRWYGLECDFYVMILDLLGPSLEDLFNFCDRKFSLKTVLLLVDQLIPRVEYVHSKSLVHLDIKPDNFLLGTGRLGNLVHIIDFGLTEEYRDEVTLTHKKYYENRKLGGTTRYASINNHLGIGFTDQPDYSYLRKLFRDLFVREGFEYDHVFDWTIKVFYMTYSNDDELAEDEPVQTRDSRKGETAQRDIKGKSIVHRPRASPAKPTDGEISEGPKAAPRKSRRVGARNED